MGKTALLLLDLQQGVIDRVKDDVPDYINKVNNIANAAQAANIPAIYVRVGFRTGYPDISPNNASFAHVPSTGYFTEEDLSFEFPNDLGIQVENIVVTKRRVSAFAGTDLAVVLRSLGVDSLVMLGISTSGAVLSTVRQAADLDYKLTLLGDMCYDPDPEIGKFLLEKILKKQARIMEWEEWVKEISGA